MLEKIIELSTEDFIRNWCLEELLFGTYNKIYINDIRDQATDELLAKKNMTIQDITSQILTKDGYVYKKGIYSDSVFNHISSFEYHDLVLSKVEQRRQALAAEASQDFMKFCDNLIMAIRVYAYDSKIQNEAICKISKAKRFVEEDNAFDFTIAI